MSNIVFQTEIAKLHHESMHFPAALRGATGIHRLQIAGDLEEMGHELTGLTLHESEWIVFASGDALEDSPVPLTVIDLDRKQSLRFEWLSMFHKAVYGTFTDLSQATELMTSSLWDLAGGIALPLDDTSNASVTEALEIQLALDERLMKAVKGRQGAFVMACTDAWGVDVVWSANSLHASHLETMARQLAG
jgi:hypothetical protein